MASERALRLQAARCRMRAAELHDGQEAIHLAFLADFLDLEAACQRWPAPPSTRKALCASPLAL